MNPIPTETYRQKQNTSPAAAPTKHKTNKQLKLKNDEVLGKIKIRQTEDQQLQLRQNQNK